MVKYIMYNKTNYLNIEFIDMINTYFKFNAYKNGD